MSTVLTIKNTPAVIKKSSFHLEENIIVLALQLEHILMMDMLAII